MWMTWKTLTDLLAREFRNLRRMNVVSFGFASAPVFNADELREEELAWASRVDSIVGDYARTRRWPALDEKERFFLRERIRFAYEFSSIAEISVRRPVLIAERPEVSNEQRRLIEWLLIDVWRKSGVKVWLEPFFLMTQSGATAQVSWDLQTAE